MDYRRCECPVAEAAAEEAALRLAHGWRLAERWGLPKEAIRDFIRPAVRAVPRAMAARLKGCRISLPPRLNNAACRSKWTETAIGLEIAVASAGLEGHDVAMELLLCLGQAVWETATPGERETYLKELRAEIEAAVAGEIDEDALREKRLLLSSRVSAQSRRRLARYARASFAGTVAEYVHCLWHEVTVRVGPEYLPGRWLRYRLEMLARWFPPNRGYRLYG